MDYVIEKKIHSDIKCVKLFAEETLQNLKHIINADAFFNTKLILYELMINSVLHGNCGDLNKSVNIKIYINKTRIIIEVSDEGTGVCCNHKNLGEYDYAESGRGLMLVEGLADKLEIEGNTVTCVQYIK